MRRPPWTLTLGLLIILVCEVMLFVDVHNRGHIVIGPDFPNPAWLPRPQTTFAWVARWVAVNMTGLCWLAYLLVLDGLLTQLGWRQRGKPSPPHPPLHPLTLSPPLFSQTLSPIRLRPNRFVIAWLTSIPVWCFFDWINFVFMDAWRYHGLPPYFAQRATGYFIAFAAISPGMFLAAELYQRMGMARLGGEGSPRWAVRINTPMQIAIMLLGLAFAIYPLLIHDPIANLTLWVSLLFFLDPINHWLGAPSIVGDWRAGRWGRTLSLMLGGATCGLLWEFWNYWALAKWSYHLPFLGSLEQYRYFEMPLLGFMGFLPFALECWVVLNLILAVFERLGLRVTEPLPDAVGVM